MDTITEKYCKSCKTTKGVIEFYRVKRPCLYAHACKDCFSQHYQRNKAAIADRNKKFYDENQERLVAEKRAYREANRDKVNEISLLSCHKNPEPRKKTMRIYRNENKDYFRDYARVYHQERAKSDVNFKIQSRLRSRMTKAIKNNCKTSYKKAGSSVKDLGCSIQEARGYIEAKFQPGMNWDNWSKDGWELDHIIPLASFDLSNREEFLKACHYTNLQPLWASEHKEKSANDCRKINELKREKEIL